VVTVAVAVLVIGALPGAEVRVDEVLLTDCETTM
jgi:hypothetical protein